LGCATNGKMVQVLLDRVMNRFHCSISWNCGKFLNSYLVVWPRIAVSTEVSTKHLILNAAWIENYSVVGAVFSGVTRQ